MKFPHDCLFEISETELQSGCDGRAPCLSFPNESRKGTRWQRIAERTSIETDAEAVLHRGGVENQENRRAVRILKGHILDVVRTERIGIDPASSRKHELRYVSKDVVLHIQT